MSSKISLVASVFPPTYLVHVDLHSPARLGNNFIVTIELVNRTSGVVNELLCHACDHQEDRSGLLYAITWWIVDMTCTGSLKASMQGSKV